MLLAFSRRSAACGRERQQGLSVLARGVSMRAWGLRLRRAATHSHNARRNIAFRVVLPRRRPGCLFSELNGQPTYTPVQRFKCVLTGRPRMARGQDGSLLLSCMTLSFTTPRRFIPTLSERFGLIASVGLPTPRQIRTRKVSPRCMRRTIRVDYSTVTVSTGIRPSLTSSLGGSFTMSRGRVT